jgi:aminopeptidase N
LKGAIPDDLYRSLENAARQDGSLSSGITVKSFMDSWADQSGIPMIFVTRDDDGVITITQVIKRIYSIRFKYRKRIYVLRSVSLLIHHHQLSP